MVVGMNITDDEVIECLKRHIDPREWSANDFDLILSRCTSSIAPYGDFVFTFKCSLADILLDADGNFVDAHPGA